MNWPPSLGTWEGSPQLTERSHSHHPTCPEVAPTSGCSEDVERTVTLTYSGRHTSGPSPSISAWRYWNSIHYPSIGNTMDVQVTEAVGVTFHAGSTQEIPPTVPLGFSASDGGTPVRCCHTRVLGFGCDPEMGAGSLPSGFLVTQRTVIKNLSPPILYDITSTWSLKNNTNEGIRTTEIDSQT